MSSSSPSRGVTVDSFVAVAIGLEAIEEGSTTSCAQAGNVRHMGASNGGQRSAQQQLQTAAAGIDDAGPAQNRQQLLSTLDRGARLRRRRGKDVLERAVRAQ